MNLYEFIQFLGFNALTYRVLTAFMSECVEIVVRGKKNTSEINTRQVLRHESHNDVVVTSRKHVGSKVKYYYCRCYTVQCMANVA